MLSWAAGPHALCNLDILPPRQSARTASRVKGDLQDPTHIQHQVVHLEPLEVIEVPRPGLGVHVLWREGVCQL